MGIVSLITAFGVDKGPRRGTDRKNKGSCITSKQLLIPQLGYIRSRPLRRHCSPVAAGDTGQHRNDAFPEAVVRVRAGEWL